MMSLVMTGCASMSAPFPYYSCPEEVTEADVESVLSRYTINTHTAPGPHPICVEKVNGATSCVIYSEQTIYLEQLSGMVKKETIKHEVCHVMMQDRGIDSRLHHNWKTNEFVFQKLH